VLTYMPVCDVDCEVEVNDYNTNAYPFN
jgi:hypothetical protein